jgi:hypothetical protein
MLSYGLALVALLIGAVLLHRRRPVLAWPVAVGLAAVVGVFAALGFRWWAAYPVLHERYWAGLASARPAWYWLLGNLAALALCLGPAVWAGLGVAARRATSEPIPLWRGGLAWSGWGRPGAALVVAASLCVLAAELSLMSKAEVERIWLPFVPWLVLATGWLPAATDRRLLAVQAATGLLLAHLVWSPW